MQKPHQHTLLRTAGDVLRHWNIVPSAICAAAGGFSAARVFQVVDRDQVAHALRATPLTDVPLESHRARLRQLLTAVRETANVPLPVPHLCPPQWQDIATCSGGCVTPDAVRLDGLVWQLEPWLPGAARTGDELTETARDAGIAMICTFHRAAREFAERPGSGELTVSRARSPALIRRCELAFSLGHRELTDMDAGVGSLDRDLRPPAEAILNAVRTHLPDLGRTLLQLKDCHVDLQPALRDVWRAHVLFQGDTVSGLIDVSGCRTDHVTLDFTRLFRSWFGANNAAVVKAWQAYAKHRSLTQIDCELVRAFDACTVLFSPMTWLRRFMTGPPRKPVAPAVERRFRELAGVAAEFEPLPPGFL